MTCFTNSLSRRHNNLSCKETGPEVYNICASRAAPAGGGPASPAGPGGPSGGGGGGSGGASPPPGPPPLPLGGTGAAISNTQCSSRLNLTLLVNNWSIDTQLSTAYASIRVACVLL